MGDKILYRNAMFYGTGGKLLRARYVDEIYKFGLYYNHPTVKDPRKITSSDDWIIPRYTVWSNDNNDFYTLATYLGGYAVAGGLCKLPDENYWYPGMNNVGATNSALFNGIGAGERYYDGGFAPCPGFINAFWTDCNSGLNFNLIEGGGVPANLAGNTAGFSIPRSSSYGTSKIGRAVSLRLVRNNTNLSNGESGVYLGNNGKLYRTICIGTQEWLAENLKETKFRNGDTIPEVTSTDDWDVHNYAYNITSGNGYAYSYTTAEVAYSQSFTTDFLRMVRVSFSCASFNSVNLRLQCAIYNESGGLPTTLVMSSGTTGYGPPTSEGYVPIYFHFPDSLASGTYCVAVWGYTVGYLPTHNATDRYGFEINTGNPYSSGTMASKTGAGSWTVMSGVDMVASVMEPLPQMCAPQNDWDLV